MVKAVATYPTRFQNENKLPMFSISQCRFHSIIPCDYETFRMSIPSISPDRFLELQMIHYLLFAEFADGMPGAHTAIGNKFQEDGHIFQAGLLEECVPVCKKRIFPPRAMPPYPSKERLSLLRIDAEYTGLPRFRSSLKFYLDVAPEVLRNATSGNSE